jgi:mannose-6-phosphate isomerase-like protein (cupin superfamily)
MSSSPGESTEPTLPASPPSPVDLVQLAQLETSARQVDDTLAHREWLVGSGYRVGYIRFSPGRSGDRPILHSDQDVLCLVLAGKGRLLQPNGPTEIEPGLLCRIPAGTPHRFAPGDGPLDLLYTLIQVGERADQSG